MNDFGEPNNLEVETLELEVNTCRLGMLVVLPSSYLFGEPQDLSGETGVLQSRENIGGILYCPSFPSCSHIWKFQISRTRCKLD
jgi:hypothetical protein